MCMGEIGKKLGMVGKGEHVESPCFVLKSLHPI